MKYIVVMAFFPEGHYYSGRVLKKVPHAEAWLQRHMYRGFTILARNGFMDKEEAKRWMKRHEDIYL